MTDKPTKVDLEESEKMGKCAICGKTGVSLLYAKHRRRGNIWLCSECWREEYNNLVPSDSS